VERIGFGSISSRRRTSAENFYVHESVVAHPSRREFLTVTATAAGLAARIMRPDTGRRRTLDRVVSESGPGR
jgi:hypothetical protein